jgi:hypothetical protein
MTPSFRPSGASGILGLGAGLAPQGQDGSDPPSLLPPNADGKALGWRSLIGEEDDGRFARSFHG